MILIGQYDSPFVRRVGIALTLYGLPFEHRPWSVFGESENIRGYNPLVRVPTLVLDDGVSLLESHCILDHLDDLVGPQRAMFPTHGAARRDALRAAALAMGMAEKAVALFYELRLHAQVSPVWSERCRMQIASVATALERERAAGGPEFWLGQRLGHADVALAAALRFVNDAHPGLLPMAQLPALAAHAARMEALPVFKSVSQPFIPPSS
jgi:glutathione S-transferase